MPLSTRAGRGRAGPAHHRRPTTARGTINSALTCAAVAALTAAILLVTAGAAGAHVQVTSDSAVIGSDATVTFRVPSESAAASTVKVVVTLPTNPPLLSVSVQAVSGWTAALTQAELPRPVVVDGTTLTRAPHQVTWTAIGGGVPPGQFTQLALLIEGLPDTSTLTFPTAQYYSDGSVVVWDQAPRAGAAEPDHPVPSLHLVRAAPAAAADAGPDQVTRGLAAAALAVALIAMWLAARRGPRRPPVTA